MHEEDLADALDRILSERVREAPATYPTGLRGAVQRAIRWIRERLGEVPDAQATLPWQWELIARIRSLPAHMQEPLRRYFVFREAEESICRSINTTSGEFRRFVQDAVSYILMRQDRMPQLERKDGSET